MNTLHLIVASVGETRFDGAVSSVTVPSREGVLTILPNHEPLIAELKQGRVRSKPAPFAWQLSRL